ncbi:MAG: Pyridinium-3,5-bisthiocarboxylic acid mononucleotide nickel insertion protein, partial [Verrucomicrobiales bacterium]|nr:Pyridinium-3,5-bisthiocarboxylic acid mononucleotide nickel insertion protein [Verrucomicrobiales bacterium]
HEAHSHEHAHAHTDSESHHHPHDEGAHEHDDHAHEHYHPVLKPAPLHIEHHSHHEAHEQEHSHEHEHGHSHLEPEHAHGRTFAEIRALIQSSQLSAWVKSRSVSVFERIARAEGKIHGKPPEEVHFHEVGAIDSIVDIVGGCVALEMLGKPRVLAGPVTEGHGWVQCAHGRFPIPAPATLAIFAERAIPISQSDEPHELVTPTGAALLAEFAESFDLLRDFTPERIGFGLGGRENKTRPNVLRAVLGTSSSSGSGNDWDIDRIAVLESNLDDINGEILGHFVEKAFAAGALDVFHTPVQMKKNRPGVLLSVLCEIGAIDSFSELILRETTALGVRHSVVERRKLKREQRPVKTEFGEITVKIGTLNGKVIQSAPEYESCRAVATAAGVPLKEVYAAANLAIGKA